MGRTKTFISLATVFVVAFAGTAFANHVYNDVPTNSVFHDEIAEIGGQRCADGFPGGLFKPEDAVKRQQMARFVSRCGGRISNATGTADGMIPNQPLDIASVDFTATADGFVHVTAAGFASTTQVGNCPCQVQFTLYVPSIMTPIATVNGTLGGVATDSGSVFEPLSLSFVAAIEQGASTTFTLKGQALDANLTNIHFEADLTATYSPFDGDASS